MTIASASKPLRSGLSACPIPMRMVTKPRDAAVILAPKSSPHAAPTEPGMLKPTDPAMFTLAAVLLYDAMLAAVAVRNKEYAEVVISTWA